MDPVGPASGTPSVTSRPAPAGPVLLVIDSLDGGGAERYVVDLAVALHDRGWPVQVACSAGGVRAGALAEAGIPVSVLGGGLVKRRVSGRYARALRRLVRERNETGVAKALCGALNLRTSAEVVEKVEEMGTRVDGGGGDA